MACICGNHFRYCAALPLQMQLQTIRKQSCTALWKLMHVQNQRSLKEAFHFFGRNLSIRERSLQIYGTATLQLHFRKMFWLSASFFWMHTIYCSTCFTAINGDPTWPDCFLRPFGQMRRNGPPSANQGLSVVTAESCHFILARCWNQSPLPDPPFLLVQNLNLSPMDCQKWHHKLKVCIHN